MAQRQRKEYGVTVTYYIEKQTDVLLSSDLVFHAANNSIDRAIVLTADADIVPGIKRCVELGVPVELVRFRGAVPRIYQLENVSSLVRRAKPGLFIPYSDSN